jgi:hypothetical protein
MHVKAARGQAQRILPIRTFPWSKGLGSAKGGFACMPREGARDAMLLPCTHNKFPSPTFSTLPHTLSYHSLPPNRRTVRLPPPRSRSNEEVVHHRRFFAASACWGLVQITKIYWLCNPKLPKDLSNSNAITVNRSSDMYPHRPNEGIMLPHKRWRWRRRSRPQGREDLGAMTPALHELLGLGLNWITMKGLYPFRILLLYFDVLRVLAVVWGIWFPSSMFFVSLSQWLKHDQMFVTEWVYLTLYLAHLLKNVHCIWSDKIIRVATSLLWGSTYLVFISCRHH